MINVILKDGSKKEVAEGASCLELAKSISEGLARNMTAAIVNRRSKRFKICFRRRKQCRNPNL